MDQLDLKKAVLVEHSNRAEAKWRSISAATERNVWPTRYSSRQSARSSWRPERIRENSDWIAGCFRAGLTKDPSQFYKDFAVLLWRQHAGSQSVAGTARSNL